MSSVAKVWDMTIFPDGECESTPSASCLGDGDQDCTELTASRPGVEFDNMASCLLTLYSDDSCQDVEQVYDFGEEDECIPPDFTWNSFDVDGC
jgi:hypothetical protein